MIKESDIAVIGVAGRFPLANNPREFHEILRAGTDCVRNISDKRIEETTVPNKQYRPLAFIEDIDKFDYRYFGYSLGEAEEMDPHQRIALEIVHEAMENAGYDPAHFNNSNTSVFFCSPELCYHEHFEEIGGTALTGNLTGITPGVISRYFNLIGSSLYINTTCSSSLVAVHYACKELLRGDSDCAIVSGINLSLFPYEDEQVKAFGISSPDGKAKAFSAAANGTGGGEAATCVLLKPLSKAIADGDNIQAIIKGSAVNQDARRSSFLTSPSKAAQEEVIKMALKNAQVEAESISFIEAHGTGTKLGDPIELDAITNAFGESTNKKMFCAISTVKSNIGHTNMAAGLVGFVKAVLSLKHRELFPSLHFDRPNPFIQFENGPTYVNTQLESWEDNQTPMRGGVSSFGLCGTNCHIILEEGTERLKTELSESKTNKLFVISSKYKEGLEKNIFQLKEYLERNDGLNLDNVSYTLATGRPHHDFRSAVVASNIPELVSQLSNLDGAKPSEQKLVLTFTGSQSPDKITLELLRTYHPKFGSIHDELCQSIDGPIEGNGSLLVFQVALFRLLETYDLVSRELLGIGVGELAVDVIMGDKKLGEALSLTNQYSEFDHDQIKEKLNAYLKRRGESGDLQTHLEVGLEGILLEAAKSHTVNHQNLTILPVCSKEDAQQDPLLSLFSQSYLLGLSINWNSIFEGKGLKRLELPTYCFEKPRVWIKEQSTAKPNEFFEVNWESKPYEAEDNIQNFSGALIFMDNSDLAEKVSQKLTEKDVSCIRVYKGELFKKQDDLKYSMNWEVESDYFQLMSSIEGRSFDLVIHLGGYFKDSETVLSNHEESLNNSLYSQFFLLKQLHEHHSKTNLKLLLVTADARRVYKTEPLKNPLMSVVYGFATSIEEEYKNYQIKRVDLDSQVSTSLSSQLLINELKDERDPTIAYRKDNRFTPSIQKRVITDTSRIVFKEGGTYMVTGGSSGIGLEIAKFIGTMKVNLVIVGRKKLPKREEWEKIINDQNHPNHAVVLGFKEIEARGSKVYYKSSMLEDKTEVTTLVKWINEKIGKVNGLIHSAGVPGKHTLANHSIDSFKEGLNPKLAGTLNLMAALGDTLEFTVFFSSYSAYIGAARNSNYSAANIFLDHLALNLHNEKRPVLSINWPAWKETGMYHRFANEFKTESDQFALSTEDGIQIFNSILSSGIGGQIIVGADFKNQIFNAARNLEKEIDVNVQSMPVNIKDFPQRLEWSDIERKVGAIWFSILKDRDLTLDSDFFRLGGHSINGAQIITRVQADFGLSIDFENLLEYSTLQQFSAFLSKLVDDKLVSEHAEESPLEEQDHYPLSFAQKDVWLADAMAPSKTVYNMLITFALNGALDRKIFEKALLLCTKSHEVLESAIILEEGLPRYKVVSDLREEFMLEFIDISDNENKDEQIEELIGAYVELPFDLARAPLLRAKLVKTEDDRHIFVLIMHHIIGDARSLNILAEEFLATYATILRQQQVVLPKKNIGYSDYILREKANYSDGHYKTAVQFWKQYLGGDLPLLKLSTDHPRSKSRLYQGDKIMERLEDDITEGIIDIAQTHRASLFQVLVSALNILLQRYSGQNDIIIGSRSARRDQKEFENVIGLFVNTYVIRTLVSPENSFKEVLNIVKENFQSIYRFQNYPFSHLTQEVSYTKQLGRPPIFDILIELIDLNDVVKGENWNDIGLEIEPYDTKRKVSKYDVVFRFKQGSEGIFLILEYNSDLFFESTIIDMATRFISLLQQVIDKPDIRVEDIDFSLTEVTAEAQTRVSFDDVFNHNF